MKKILIYLSLVATLFLTGCTKNFDAINTDPNQASAANFDPNLLLPSAELGYIGSVTGYSGPILFQSMWTQTFASSIEPGYYSGGDKYKQGGSFLSYQQGTWNGAYGAAGYFREIQNLTKGNDAKANLRGISIICELMSIQAVTDVYGDCPYSQALQAKSGIQHPVYDKQQDIYKGMLAKLDSVITTLDPSKAGPTNDVVSYKGDVAKWKKFGYSLMLRMAMRLTKADAAMAQQYVTKAYTGGVFQSNSDNAYIVFDHSHGFSNANSSAIQVQEDYYEVKWGKMLIDYLKSTNDPRLGVISELLAPGMAANANHDAVGDSNPADQLGMPNGYNQNGGANDITKAPGYPGSTGVGSDADITGNYSHPKTLLYMDYNAPAFILTYAQTEFLLAEAAARGWSVGVSASVHYANAVSAALQTYGTYNALGTISSSVANAFAAAHPLDISSTDNSLKQINTQYWVYAGTIFDFDEAWSNWRRSGYPVLTPVVYPGNFTNGTIPRRQAYPTGEASTNPVNFTAAVSALTGGDVYSSRVWWDK